MSLGAKRRRHAERVYRAPELTAATRDEAREGLRAERARLLGQLAGVEAALREMGDA